VAVTYDEHAQLLRSILRRKGDEACLLLKSHIETSKQAVRKITLHRLFVARNAGAPGGTEGACPGAYGAPPVASPRPPGQTV
jgi:hypothetical protein